MRRSIEPLDITGPNVPHAGQLAAKVNELVDAVNLLFEQAEIEDLFDRSDWPPTKFHNAYIPVQTLHGQVDGAPESSSEDSKERQ